MLNNLVAVFIGGGIGSLLRFGVSLLVMQYSRSVFPLATLVSNVLSCVIFGLVVYFMDGKATTDTSLKLLLLTGLCGGFSTFSAFSYETVELIKGGNTMYAAANIFISVAACFGIIYFLTRSAVA